MSQPVSSINRRGTSRAGLEQPTGASAVSHSTVVRRRVKPCSIFFLTLSLPTYYESIRHDILLWFTGLLTFVISVEESKTSEQVSFHAHCFLHFSDKIFLSDLREYIDVCVNLNFGGCHFDLQSCKSRKSCIKYVTKEDRNSIYNCKESELHFFRRSLLWVSRTDQFRCNDPFVVEHRFCYRFLEKLFNDEKRKLDRVCNLKPVLFAYVNWSLDVSLWWNKAIRQVGYKNKCLYLHGSTNVGKSSFIERCIGRVNMPFVYYPGVGKFFMQDYDPFFHKVILFEEFTYEYHCIGMLKRLMEGRSYSYPVKGLSDRVLIHKGPIIFISNHYSDSYDSAFLSRLFVVSAEEAFWDSLVSCIPKEEVDASAGADEVLVVEDSDDETSFLQTPQSSQE